MGKVFLLVSHMGTVVRNEELAISLPFVPSTYGVQKLPNKVISAKKEVKMFGKCNVQEASPLSLAKCDPERTITPVIDVSLRASERVCLRVGKDKTHVVVMKT